MSVMKEEQIKRWAARRKSALVLEIIQVKTAVSETSSIWGLPRSEESMEHGKARMQNALHAKPDGVSAQYERQLKYVQSAYGEAMQELRVQKNCSPC